MNTYETVQDHIKTAMKNHDDVTRDVLRRVVSDIKNQTVNAGKEISEDIVIKCLNKIAKQYHESIEQYKSAGRNDLVEKETKESNIVNEFLPKAMSEEDIKKIIDDLCKTIEPIKKNMGQFMKHLTDPSINKQFASSYLKTFLK